MSSKNEDASLHNHQRLLDIETSIRAATQKHNAFLLELGLPGLPGGVATG